jgi:indoleacetamide hydrolase
MGLSMSNLNHHGGHGNGDSAGGANARATTSAYHSLGVAAAAAAIRRGEISAEAYAGALLSRARQNARLNAFITIDDTAVLAAARAADKARAQGADAPLLGVPLAVKDSYMTRGSGDRVAPISHTLDTT